MERTLGHENGRELRPAQRLTGRDLLAALDRRRREDLDRTGWSLAVPPRSWRFDPRYG